MPDRERPLAGERPPKPLTRCYDRRRQALRRPLEPGQDTRPGPGRSDHGPAHGRLSAERCLKIVDRYKSWITAVQVAVLIGVGERQVFRLQKVYRMRGAKGL